MSEEAFQTAGRNALTLIRDQNLTVVLTVLKAGAVLQEHHAPAPVTLLPLFGNLILLALTRARELSHPFSQARALNIATWVHQYRREVQQTREQVEELLVIARAQDFAQWVTLGTIMSGWVLAMQGREEGVAQISQGLNANRNLSIELAHSYLFSLLTEAYAQMGQREEGLRVLAEALTLVEKNDERFYEAELHRLKGELLKPRHN